MPDIVMETLGGSPFPPALWLRRAVGAIHESPDLGYANADDRPRPQKNARTSSRLSTRGQASGRLASSAAP
jgi:hypothetical protein